MCQFSKTSKMPLSQAYQQRYTNTHPVSCPLSAFDSTSSQLTHTVLAAHRSTLTSPRVATPSFSSPTLEQVKRLLMSHSSRSALVLRLHLASRSCASS